MRQVFEVSRELEYFSEAELTMQIGRHEEEWALALLKELVDNALDACEVGDTPPAVAVTIEPDSFSVQDNGPGIPPAIVRGALDYSKRVSDKLLYVSPTRGQLGNALKVLFAAPFVITGDEGRVVIEAQGLRHDVAVRLDRIANRPDVKHEETASFVRSGTFVQVTWPEAASCLNPEEYWYSYNAAPVRTAQELLENYAAFNPHATFTLPDWQHEATDPAWSKWRTDAPPSPHWYTAETLRALVAGYLSNGNAATTVREFVSDFRGLAGSRKQAEVVGDLKGLPLGSLVAGDDVDIDTVTALLERMKMATTAPKPKALGVIGEDHLRKWLVTQCGAREETVEYRRRMGDEEGLPYVLEVAFAQREDGSAGRRLLTGLNWSATLENPIGDLQQHLQEGRVDHRDPVVLAVHIACPRLEYTERGKGKVALGQALRGDLASAMKLVTEPWRKIKAKTARQDREARVAETDRRKARRAETYNQQEAAFNIMEAAFMHASGDGRYAATARQIYYAARPMIMDLTGRSEVDYGYFNQTLLKDYLDAYEPSWADKVVWDARGQLTEPHTGERVPLGGIDVRRYMREWTNGSPQETLLDAVRVPRMIGTCGPSLRFGAVLFVEKEGFAPVLEAAEFAERYDLAIMSTKGITVAAACTLAAAFHESGVKVLVLRDFDLAGFKLVKTLSQGTRRAPGTRVWDLGLRLADVDAMGLESELVTYNQEKDPAEYLAECGATVEEQEYLVAGWDDNYTGKVVSWSGRRVELNAMTSPQLVKWLDGKMAEHDVRKIIPAGEALTAAFTQTVRKRLMQKRMEAASEEVRSADIPAVPADLGAQIAKRLTEEPTLTWDKALWDLVPQ